MGSSIYDSASVTFVARENDMGDQAAVWREWHPIYEWGWCSGWTHMRGERRVYVSKGYFHGPEAKEAALRDCQVMRG